MFNSGIAAPNDEEALFVNIRVLNELARAHTNGCFTGATANHSVCSDPLLYERETESLKGRCRQGADALGQQYPGGIEEFMTVFEMTNCGYARGMLLSSHQHPTPTIAGPRHTPTPPPQSAPLSTATTGTPLSEDLTHATSSHVPKVDTDWPEGPSYPSQQRTDQGVLPIEKIVEPLSSQQSSVPSFVLPEEPSEPSTDTPPSTLPMVLNDELKAVPLGQGDKGKQRGCFILSCKLLELEKALQRAELRQQRDLMVKMVQEILSITTQYTKIPITPYPLAPDLTPQGGSPLAVYLRSHDSHTHCSAMASLSRWSSANSRQREMILLDDRVIRELEEAQQESLRLLSEWLRDVTTVLYVDSHIINQHTPQIRSNS
eukprot:GHVN01005892.1.p1 GENE.GHVN01005892.1~~GHVN01005892.1.p1  ORF type:complete len:374 (+),score=62.51 GHVN01005892.1:42-1163(+)